MVLLVSASLAPYLEPLGDVLEVDAVLCTRLVVEMGIYTGEIDGRNCRASEKVARLRQWGESAGLTGENWLVYAYGDSSGDEPMLEFAETGSNVSRKEYVA